MNSKNTMDRLSVGQGILLAIICLIVDAVIAGILLLIYWVFFSIASIIWPAEVSFIHFVFHSWWSLIPLIILVLVGGFIDIMLWAFATDGEPMEY